MLDFLFPADQDAEDISWSDENIRVGVTWAAWQFSLKSGMYEDLKAVCGEKDARYLLALAVYKLDGQGAMMNFEDWVPQVLVRTFVRLTDVEFRSCSKRLT